jgi:hypothetical protein
MGGKGNNIFHSTSKKELTNFNFSLEAVQRFTSVQQFGE